MLNLDLIVVNGEGSQRIQTRDESVQRALESLDEPKREFISLCLNHNPSMRPKAHELLKHHVLQEVIFLPLSSLAFSTSPPFPLSFLLLPPHSFRLTIHPLLHSLTPPSLLPSVYPSLTLSPSVWLSILLFHSLTPPSLLPSVYPSLHPLSFRQTIHPPLSISSHELFNDIQVFNLKLLCAYSLRNHKKEVELKLGIVCYYYIYLFIYWLHSSLTIIR